MSEDGIKKNVETAIRKVADDSLKENAFAANNVGLEVRVTRVYDGVGLSGNRQCQWCLDRCGDNMTLEEAYAKGAFQRHPGCGCELYYKTEKGIERQKNWKTNTWEAVDENGNKISIRATEDGSQPKHWQEFKMKKDGDNSSDLLMTNPGWDSGKKEYRQNCQRCVSTYEMRRRGFDVVAKPCFDSENDKLAIFRELAWVNRKTGEVPERIWCMKGSGKAEIERLMKKWKDGARAIVGVNWKDGSGGHVFIAENRKGKIVYIDPQNGDSDCSKYFKRAKMSNINRIDDCDPSEMILDCCANRKE